MEAEGNANGSCAKVAVFTPVSVRLHLKLTPETRWRGRLKGVADGGHNSCVHEVLCSSA